MYNKAHQFQGQKATRPINAEIKSVSYLPNVKAYELQTWYRWVTKTRITDKRRQLQG